MLEKAHAAGMTDGELEQLDLQVGDRVYIAGAGNGNLSAGDIVKVTGLADWYAIGCGLLLSNSGRRFYRLARVDEDLSGMTTRIILVDGTLGPPVEWPYGPHTLHSVPHVIQSVPVTLELQWGWYNPWVTAECEVCRPYPERGYQKVVTHGLQLGSCNPWVTGTDRGAANE